MNEKDLIQMFQNINQEYRLRKTKTFKIYALIETLHSLISQKHILEQELDLLKKIELSSTRKERQLELVSSKIDEINKKLKY